jgi:hypothetical protein
MPKPRLRPAFCRTRKARFERLEPRIVLSQVMGTIPIEPIEFREDTIHTLGFPVDAPLTTEDTFQLQSRPESNFTIFLDFDGNLTRNTQWNSYYGIDTIVNPPFDLDNNPDEFSSAELTLIQNAWKRVAEDYAPFDVNVTTVDPGSEALSRNGSDDTAWGIRAVITQDTFAFCNCGGHAFIDSFNSSVDQPAFIYNWTLDGISEAITHEVGHSLNLSHDGTTMGDEYYLGHGSGATGWAPIMGAGYYQEVTTWDNGVYYAANNTGTNANYGNGYSDLDVITSLNGFGYRPSDHGDSLSTATPLATTNVDEVSGFGIIQENTDVDLFRFTTGAGNVTFSITPLDDRPNLDIWAGIYNSGGSLVAQSNPSGDLSAAFTDVFLPAGTYYLKIDGVSSHAYYDPMMGVARDPSAPAPWQVDPPEGYSQYASLGQYSITGTIVSPSVNQLTIVAANAEQAEGNTGNSSFSFTVSRSGSVMMPGSVDYYVDLAVPGAPGENFPNTVNASDFVGGILPSGTVSFASGETTKTITLEVLGDTQYEPDESFVVVLTNPTPDWSFDTNFAVGTILSDENRLAWTPGRPNLTYREEGNTNSDFLFTVTRSGSTDVITSVDWAVSSSGLAAPVDAFDFVGNVLPSGQVTFAPTETSKTIAIPVKGDPVQESDETFRIELSNPTSSVPVSIHEPFSDAFGTLLNDDDVAAFDFGDAPDTTYGTSLSSNGPRHLIGGPQLGQLVDAENDGQPTPLANGDGYDEDGVIFLDPWVVGTTVNLQITSSTGGGVLDYFIDFDGADGFGNEGNEIHQVNLTGGTELISFDIPQTASPGSTYARFRISSTGNLAATGPADDGEVEDYAVTIFSDVPLMDFGDAPFSSLLVDIGPRHIAAGLQLGDAFDAELDGLSNATSTGDGGDDDGVIFGELLLAGQTSHVSVTTSTTNAVLDYFVDFDGDGTFGNTTDEVFSVTLSGGTELVPISVPADAQPGITHARFRISRAGGLSPLGLALDGEVEDYQVMILTPAEFSCVPWEYFDEAAVPQLPDEWQTTSSAGVYWETVGSDSDTAPNHAFVADVDFVSENRLISPTIHLDLANPQLRFRHDYLMEEFFDGGVLEISINGGTDQDILAAGGVFLEGGYDDFISEDYGNPLALRDAWTGDSGGYIDTIVDLPDSVIGQNVRFTWLEGTDNSVPSFGWRIDTIQLCGRGDFSYDFGDAPDPSYPTSLASSGPAHVVGGDVYLGAAIDAESAPLPDEHASGDDSVGASDDEDGVQFSSELIPGELATIRVDSSAGLLNAWLDFNGDGDWLDDGEQVFKDLALLAGTHDLSFSVPHSAVVTDETFARFRLSSQSGLTVTGSAPDGEVEDYTVAIVSVENTAAIDDVFVVSENSGPTLLDVLANDSGSDLALVSASSPSRGAMVTVVDDQIQYSPAAGFVGQEALTYTLTDGVQESTATVIVKVGTPLHAYIDFDDYEIQSFNGPQNDVEGTATVEAEGAALHLVGNLMKAIDWSYTVTERTRLEFDFRSTVEGEVHAIGTDLTLEPEGVFKVYGTQPGNYTEMDDYAAHAPNYAHYVVYLGDVLAGDMTKLWFMNDHDVPDPDAEGVFANVRIYEASGTPQAMKDDIIGRVESSGDWWVAKSSGTSFTNQKWNRWSTAVSWEYVLTGDFNGDGRDDVAGRVASSGSWYVATSTENGATNGRWGSWPTSISWQHVFVGDVNGDGLADLIGQDSASGRWHVAKSTGSGFVNATWGRWSPTVTWLDVQTGDFNGDGRTDLVGRVETSGDWWVARSVGTSFVNARWSRWSPSVEWQDVLVADFSGDGLSDIAGRVASSGKWYVATSSGTEFSNAQWGRWSTSVVWEDVLASDFNGDGLSDIAGRVGRSGTWWVATSTATSFTNAEWGHWSAIAGWVDLQVGDFDGDGSSDIAGRSSINGDWWVARSTGTSFESSKWGHWSTTVDWLDVQVGNFDGFSASSGDAAGESLAELDRFWATVGEECAEGTNSRLENLGLDVIEFSVLEEARLSLARRRGD